MAQKCIDNMINGNDSAYEPPMIRSTDGECRSIQDFKFKCISQTGGEPQKTKATQESQRTSYQFQPAQQTVYVWGFSYGKLC